MNNTPAILAEKFRCRYTNGDVLRLKDITIELSPGDFVAIVGPSGGGKSTLGLAINGLIPHEIEGSETGGGMYVLGCEVKRQKPHDLFRMVGTVLQDPEWQLVTFTVADEIAFGLENLGVPVPDIIERVNKLSGLLSIDDLLDRSPDELSGGQKQRIAIASCLAMEPPILLLDEPMAELDPAGKQTVLEAVVSLNKEHGVTVLFIDHNLDVIAPHADSVIVIENGEIVAQGPPEKVFGDRELLETIRLRPPQSVEISTALPSHLQLSSPALSVISLLDSISARDLPPLRYVPDDEHEDPVRSDDVVAKAEQLWFKYPDGPEAVRGVDFTIRQGDFIGVIGQNGSGKSTLAKLLTNLLTPDRGEVTVYGESIRQLARDQIASKIGFVFQNPDFQFFSKTCYEEVAFGMILKQVDQKEIERKVDAVFEQLEIVEYKDEHPHFLSRGQRRRVAIASVLVLEPNIIVLDEPTTGLDTGAVTRMLDVVRGLHRDGHTIVMLTHEMRAVLEYCNRVMLMHQGAIMLDDDPSRTFHQREILESCDIRLPPVAEFITAFSWQEPPIIPRTSAEAAALVARAIDVTLNVS